MHARSFSHDTTINHMSVWNSQKSIVKHQLEITNSRSSSKDYHCCTRAKQKRKPISLNHAIRLHCTRASSKDYHCCTRAKKKEKTHFT